MLLDAKAALDLYDKLLADQQTFRSHWQEIAERILTRRSEFTAQFAPGQKRTLNQFDTAGIFALDRFASGLHNALMPEGEPWCYLDVDDQKFRHNRAVRLWLQDTSHRLLAALNRAEARFHPSVSENCYDLGAWGSTALFILDRPGFGPYFQAPFFGECVFIANDDGAVDGLARSFKWDPKQIVQRFGDAAPKVVHDRLRNGNGVGYFEKMEIVHCIYKDPESKSDKPWQNIYVLREGTHTLFDGGFDRFPAACPRWTTTSAEVYGRSPAMNALPDIKMLNAMYQTYVQGLQQSVTPPMLVDDTGEVKKVMLQPGALNYVRRGPNGSESIRPLEIKGHFQAGFEFIQDIREAVKNHFYLDVLRLMGPLAPDGNVLHMSATEVSIRQRDRMRELGPVFSRMRSEMIAPIITQSLYILEKNGMLAERPQELLGRPLHIRYKSPLAVATEGTEAGTVMQMLSVIQPIAQIDKSGEVLRAINPTRTLRILAEGLNAPMDMLNSPAEIQKLKEQEQQAAQAAAMLQQAQAANQASQAAANLGAVG